MLAKAIGLNKFKNPHVLDATAGLGRDSFVLACLGCKVDMVERSALVHTLLEDGLKRANDDEEISAITSNITLTRQDSYEYISNINACRRRPLAASERKTSPAIYPNQFVKSPSTARCIKGNVVTLKEEPDTCFKSDTAITVHTSRLMASARGKVLYSSSVMPRSTY